MNIERLVTLAIILGGLLFLLQVIPAEVETVDYGRMGPQTLPKIVTIIIILAACIQFFTEQTSIRFEPLIVLRTAIFIGLIILSVYLMTLLGFEYVAPPLALIVMVMIGERRWYWLVGGALVVPIGCWLIVEKVLGRLLV